MKRTSKKRLKEIYPYPLEDYNKTVKRLKRRLFGLMRLPKKDTISNYRERIFQRNTDIGEILFSYFGSNCQERYCGVNFSFNSMWGRDSNKKRKLESNGLVQFSILTPYWSLSDCKRLCKKLVNKCFPENVAYVDYVHDGFTFVFDIYGIEDFNPEEYRKYLAKAYGVDIANISFDEVGTCRSWRYGMPIYINYDLLRYTNFLSVNTIEVGVQTYLISEEEIDIYFG